MTKHSKEHQGSPSPMSLALFNLCHTPCLCPPCPCLAPLPHSPPVSPLLVPLPSTAPCSFSSTLCPPLLVIVLSPPLCVLSVSSSTLCPPLCVLLEAAPNCVSGSGLQSRIENAVLELSGPLPRSQRRWMEVVFGSVGDWQKRMAKIAPESTALPGILSLQDDLGDDMSDGILESDCLREKWLSKLLPTPSSFEDSNSPPSMCKTWRERDRGTIFERLIGS